MAKGIKSGGRVKGTPNRITKDVRECINDFIQNNIDTLQDDFNKLEPKDRLMFIDKMLKYLIPSKVDTEIQNIPEKSYIKLPDGTLLEI